MLKLLLDEHISPMVAEGLRRKDRAINVLAMVEWENGNFLGQDDAACLRAASSQRLTLATYDRRTISHLLKRWAEEGHHHAGVTFVDDKTIAPSDIGGLIRALSSVAKQARNWDWTNRICFLRR